MTRRRAEWIRGIADRLIAGARRRNADLNGDLTERAGSTSRRVGMFGPGHHASSATTSKFLTVRRRDRCIHTERSGPFRQIAVKDPRSAVRQVQGVRVVESPRSSWSFSTTLHDRRGSTTERGSQRRSRGKCRIGSSPGRDARTGAPLLSIHDVKVFDGPVERSLRRHGAIRPFPSDRRQRSAFRRSAGPEVQGLRLLENRLLSVAFFKESDPLI